ncbi:LysR family transcriptional regulator [Pseudomonas putida]|uniref:LysR family transcriptional regulator n=1 Tax=Pseudomonas putida TaxID=303 RepID=A0A6I6XUZ1_PSEPU|nr:LysR family transcriptional regulator [Pseudomonas putida]QHG65172.1 LysR family transcriptional regulator [Pseudomonas putida]
MKSDIRHFDLNLLKALDALLDERSVTKAAQRLSLTQPAVSGMLTRLRDSFDDPLFVRAQRGMVPTLRAQQLSAPVKQLISDLEALLQPEAFDPATSTILVTVAATDYALRAVVVPFLSTLRKQAPNIRVAVKAVDISSLPTQLEQGEVDIALVTPEMTPPGVSSQNLFDERYVCVMRADHPDAHIPTLSLDRFCELDHVLVSPAGGSFNGVTDKALSQIHRQRRVSVSVSSFLIVPELLSTSDMIAVIPERLTPTDKSLILRTPPVDIPGFTKAMAWHERTDRDAGQRWIRSIMLETCGR